MMTQVMERASLAFSNPSKFKLFQSCNSQQGYADYSSRPFVCLQTTTIADVLQPASTSLLNNMPKNVGNVSPFIGARRGNQEEWSKRIEMVLIV